MTEQATMTTTTGNPATAAATTPGPGSEPLAGSYAPWRITLGELDRKMGMQVLEQSVQRVVVTMPVAGNRQSLGLLHGGAMLALGEAVGSWAALIHASTRGMVCVGVDANATHHRSTRDGVVTAVATPIRLGGTLTSHEVVISDEEGNRLSTFRITNLLRPAKH
jgi:uncharacterized protein (TIGR00369 family)